MPSTTTSVSVECGRLDPNSCTSSSKRRTHGTSLVDAAVVGLVVPPVRRGVMGTRDASSTKTDGVVSFLYHVWRDWYRDLGDWILIRLAVRVVSVVVCIVAVRYALQ